MRLAGLAVLARPSGLRAQAAGRVFDVTAFGAATDGKTVATPGINKAIQEAAQVGGGVVRFPAGSYLCYSIRLASNITLQLETGAKIIAGESSGGNAYDAAEPQPGAWEPYQDYGHNHWHNSLIWGENLENVAIIGPGLIWGRGLSRGTGRREVPSADDPGVANKAIALKRCKNVLLKDFAILKGGHFGILASGVDNLNIDGLTIDTDRDGMDVDCCRNVHISNCSVNSPWDDGICLKSSYSLGEAISTDMVTITNCLVTGSYELGALLDASFRRFPADARVPRTGRIKCGTESNGGFRNITISNCVFDGCQGLALESVDGALLEDIAVSNITMRDISTAPFFIRLGERMRGPKGVPVGTCKRISISNVVCHNSASRVASIVAGVPGHFVEDIRFSDILLEYQGGQPAPAANTEPAEQSDGYPDPDRFFPMPASGFYLRHVRDIEMHDVEIRMMKPDARPTFYLDDVTDADFARVKAPHEDGVATFKLHEVKNFSVEGSRPLADTVIQKTADQTL